MHGKQILTRLVLKFEQKRIRVQNRIARIVENKPVVFYFDTGGIELRENAFSFRPTVKLDANLERGEGK